MTKKNPKVYINGRMMSVKAYADAVAFNKGASKYIRDRREATRRAKQIREKSGPCSMEWVQSALFLYAAKKNGLNKDLKKAIWAYTSALIMQLEKWVTNAEKIASRENVEDSFHWVALQLRATIRNHIKLLDMYKDEVIEVPEATAEDWAIWATTHRPSNRDDYEAMSYMIGDFRRRNPGIDDILPKKDENVG